MAITNKPADPVIRNTWATLDALQATLDTLTESAADGEMTPRQAREITHAFELHGLAPMLSAEVVGLAEGVAA